MTKVIVAGTRTFNNKDLLATTLNDIHKRFPITEIVSGGAAGADTLGEWWANCNNIPVRKFPANWSKYDKAAGPIRNRLMAEYGDVLVVFWDGKSKGTQNMISEATLRGRGVKVVRYG